MIKTHTNMKAAYSTKYGSPDVIEIRDVEKPKPKDNEILVKVYASSITTADSMIRRGTPFYGRLFLGLTKPKHPILGTGFAGEVVKIGKDVTQFEIGDEVFGESTFNFSANAEFLVINENGILDLKPENVSFKAAAAVCDGPLTSFNFLTNLANIKEGDKVLVNGASGSLGTAAIQLAKYFGAQVTGVCSTNNVTLVKSLGADNVIDYKQTNFTKSDVKYDVIYDTIGTSSFSDCKKVLEPKGIYMSPVLSMNLLCDTIRTSIIKKKSAKFSATGILKEDELRKMLFLISDLLANKDLRMVIDKEYKLDEIRDAHNYIESGRKRGNVVLTFE